MTSYWSIIYLMFPTSLAPVTHISTLFYHPLQHLCFVIMDSSKTEILNENIFVSDCNSVLPIFFCFYQLTFLPSLRPVLSSILPLLTLLPFVPWHFGHIHLGHSKIKMGLKFFLFSFILTGAPKQTEENLTTQFFAFIYSCCWVPLGSQYCLATFYSDDFISALF